MDEKAQSNSFVRLKNSNNSLLCNTVGTLVLNERGYVLEFFFYLRIINEKELRKMKCAKSLRESLHVKAGKRLLEKRDFIFRYLESELGNKSYELFCIKSCMNLKAKCFIRQAMCTFST